MPRHFNTTGPCDAERHYMVPPLRRAGPMRVLIENGSYFVLHAPRQSGKTTTILALAKALNEEGDFAVVAASMAHIAPLGSDIALAERAIVGTWIAASERQLPHDLAPPPVSDPIVGFVVNDFLSRWAEACPRKLVLFIDETDALQDAVLLSLLRQLHSGFPSRPRHFPWSVALIGMLDVRDYKVSDNEGRRLGTASPFNIKDRSLTLASFTPEEIADLYGQHTADTGQVFAEGVLEQVLTLTRGHPWLVNALARELVEEIVPDRTKPVLPEHVEVAKEAILERRDAHVGSLAERLREDRVRVMIEAILLGNTLPNASEDDYLYVIDLGLVRKTQRGPLEIANPIYAEAIPRLLTRRIDASMGTIRPTWLLPDGQLDADKLLDAFLAFWRRHAGALMGTAPYHESAPHLVMMAFLQRAENGGGTLHREFAIGSGRLDLLLEYKQTKIPMELKVWRPGEPDPVKDGLEQIDEYLSGLGLSTGWLVIFDRRPKTKRTARDAEARSRKTPAGRKVTVIRA